eukprot:TRINITY_DN32743_c0_g1_i5.p2 TRINITY_DN32743_c0_g1~~TRINITY_DN32743_c0_g1_i5.p2  ORF type:complete len:208 (+),score=74.31 TRINITY_DN32743_c0_g1_i5:104-727(+)
MCVSGSARLAAELSLGALGGQAAMPAGRTRWLPAASASQASQEAPAFGCAPSRSSTSFGERTEEGIAKLKEADALVKEQTIALSEITKKVSRIREAAAAVSELQGQLKSVEAAIGDSMDEAEVLLGTETGFGEMAQQLAKVKAMARHQQHATGLAKVAIDGIVSKIGQGTEVKSASSGVLVSALPMLQQQPLLPPRRRPREADSKTA